MIKDTASGLWLRPDTNDAWIVKEGSTSYAHLDIDAAGVVLDLGAHIGSFAVYAAKRGAKHVFAYEPHPDNYRLLSRNTKGLPISLYNAAVAEKDGSTNLFVAKTAKGTAMHRTSVVRGRESILVATARLSSVIRNLKPTIIKVDIEGAEIDLFHNLKIPPFVKQIAMEVHWTLKPEYRQRSEEMINNLLAQGFYYGSKRRLAFTDWNPVITLKRKGRK